MNYAIFRGGVSSIYFQKQAPSSHSSVKKSVTETNLQKHAQNNSDVKKLIEKKLAFAKKSMSPKEFEEFSIEAKKILQMKDVQLEKLDNWLEKMQMQIKINFSLKMHKFRLQSLKENLQFLNNEKTNVGLGESLMDGVMRIVSDEETPKEIYKRMYNSAKKTAYKQIELIQKDLKNPKIVNNLTSEEMQEYKNLVVELKKLGLSKIEGFDLIESTINTIIAMPETAKHAAYGVKGIAKGVYNSVESIVIGTFDLLKFMGKYTFFGEYREKINKQAEEIYDWWDKNGTGKAVELLEEALRKEMDRISKLPSEQQSEAIGNIAGNVIGMLSVMKAGGAIISKMKHLKKADATLERVVNSTKSSAKRVEKVTKLHKKATQVRQVLGVGNTLLNGVGESLIGFAFYKTFVKVTLLLPKTSIPVNQKIQEINVLLQEMETALKSETDTTKREIIENAMDEVRKEKVKLEKREGGSERREEKLEKNKDSINDVDALKKIEKQAEKLTYENFVKNYNGNDKRINKELDDLIASGGAKKLQENGIVLDIKYLFDIDHWSVERFIHQINQVLKNDIFTDLKGIIDISDNNILHISELYSNNYKKRISLTKVLHKQLGDNFIFSDLDIILRRFDDKILAELLDSGVLALIKGSNLKNIDYFLTKLNRDKFNIDNFKKIAETGIFDFLSNKTLRYDDFKRIDHFGEFLKNSATIKDTNHLLDKVKLVLSAEAESLIDIPLYDNIHLIGQWDFKNMKSHLDNGTFDKIKEMKIEKLNKGIRINMIGLSKIDSTDFDKIFNFYKTTNNKSLFFDLYDYPDIIKLGLDNIKKINESGIIEKLKKQGFSRFDSIFTYQYINEISISNIEKILNKNILNQLVELGFENNYFNTLEKISTTGIEAFSNFLKNNNFKDYKNSVDLRDTYNIDTLIKYLKQK